MALSNPTKQDIINEIKICSKDPSYFLKNYVKVSHPTKGLVPFKLYPFQEELINSFRFNKNNLILKARQLGISTVTAGYIVWLALFYSDTNVLIIATKKTSAINMLEKVKVGYDSLPAWLKIAKIKSDNQTEMKLLNGSKIKASPCSKDAGRSEALSLLVIDEAAHIEGINDLWTGLYSTLSTGGKCIALSTPNGASNWFYDMYRQSIAGEADFVITKLFWYEHPDYDEAWFAKFTRQMNKKAIAQELMCDFLMSGEGVFSSEQLTDLEKELVEPKNKVGLDRNFWIWEDYIQGASYFISADVARGDGSDYSAFHVFKLNTLEIVAEYKGKQKPDVFARILESAAREFGNALVAIENAKSGEAVLYLLRDAGYKNIYCENKQGGMLPIGTGLSSSKAVLGFTTDSSSRPRAIEVMERFIRHNKIKINSKRLTTEMRTFIWKNGRPEASTGKNDDLVMACAIGCLIIDRYLLANTKKLQNKEDFLDSIILVKKSMDTKISGMVGYNKNYDPIAKTDPYKGFGWILKN
jgi:hypothetical protein